MPAIDLVGAGIVDHHGFAALPDVVADGGAHREFAARREAEIDAVPHLADDPAILGDPCDGRKAHAGGATDDVKDHRHGLDPADRIDVGLEVVRPWDYIHHDGAHPKCGSLPCH